VRIIAKLFAVERESTIAGDNAEQRRDRRQEKSRPILDALRSWIDGQRAVTPPKTPLGKALGYLDRQWNRLLLFLDDGNIETTNSRRERELRRLVLGRRNWLFTWLDEGGERTADILSMSPPVSRMTSTRARICTRSFTASCTDGRKQSFVSSCPTACLSPTRSSTLAIVTRSLSPPRREH